MRFNKKSEGKSALNPTIPTQQNAQLQAARRRKGGKILFGPLATANICLALFILLSAAMPGAPVVRLAADVCPAAKVSAPMPDNFSCSLPAPSSFDGARTSSTTAFLEWSTVSGAASYRLIVYDLDTHELVSNTVEYGTSKNVTGLSLGASYRCVLASMCSGGETSEFVIVVDILD